MTPNDDGVELRMRGEAKQPAVDRRRHARIRRRRVSGQLAPQDRARRHHEFSDVARRKKLSGTPVIEVTIGADGKLLQTVVRRSSGHAEIDEAAMRILKLAAPFDPFPGELAAKHDEIRIAYEWQFLGGAAQGGGVFYSEPPIRTISDEPAT
jgi:TonB family protein